MHIKQMYDREIVRETYETDTRGRPMMVRITAKGVFTWAKGTRDVEQVSLVAAHEGAKRRRTPLPTGRQMGMSARKRQALSDDEAAHQRRLSQAFLNAHTALKRKAKPKKGSPQTHAKKK